jgi:RNA polymerase sigma-70 factor (ECF subfamily)
MDPRQEEQIVARLQSGHTESFRAIAEEYTEPLFRVALGYMHSKEEAEDMVQEAMIKAYNNINSFKGDSKLSTWLYRITVNTCLNEIDKRKRRSFFSRIEDIAEKLRDTSESGETPEQQMIQQESDRKVRKAIDSLPAKQKTAFILQRYKELSQKEISEVMQLSEGAVEQLLQRGKNNLRKRLIT